MARDKRKPLESLRSVGEVEFGSGRLRVGDRFAALNKLGETSHYQIESITRKRNNLYVVLRAIGSTLDERRQDVQKYNKLNRLLPMAADALDKTEVEAAWFFERKITKIGGPDDE